MKHTAKFWENPPSPPQAAGTQYFAMDVDEVPAAGGSRPDQLAPVSGSQERVQRRVAQIEVTVPSVPILDAPVPLMWGGEEVGSVLSPWEAALTSSSRAVSPRARRGGPHRLVSA